MKKILCVFIILLLFIFLYNPNKSIVVESNNYLTPANPAFDDDSFYECVINHYNEKNFPCTYKKWKDLSGTHEEIICPEERLNINSFINDEQLSQIDSLVCLGLNYSGHPVAEFTYGYNIYSTKGLEKLYNLEFLNLKDNNISNIDISDNLKLTTLKLSNNHLEEIDISNNNLTFLEIDENVDIIGLNDSVYVDYSPKFIFDNYDTMLDNSTYEYTVNVSNNVNKFVIAYDKNNKGYHLNDTNNNSLIGGILLYDVIFNSDYKLELNNINLLDVVNDVDDYLNYIVKMHGSQCNEDGPCNIYENNELIFSYDDNNMISLYKNGNRFYYEKDEGPKPSLFYLELADLKVGTNVMKFSMSDELTYTINIIRSDKELNNNSSEEFNNILDNIINDNSIDSSPNTGMFSAMLLSLLSIAIIMLLYLKYYRKKVSNS